MPLGDAVITGGASLIGGMIANSQNAKLAAKTRAWQERMSDTAYQRATADMKLAGINPMLSYMQGGASSPSGATANMDDVVGPAVSSAMQGLRLRKELALMDAQKLKAAAEASDATQSAAVKNGLAYKVQHDIDAVDARRRYTEAQSSLVGLQAQNLRLSQPGLQNTSAYESFYLRHPWANMIRKALGGVRGSFNAGEAAKAGANWAGGSLAVP